MTVVCTLTHKGIRNKIGNTNDKWTHTGKVILFKIHTVDKWMHIPRRHLLHSRGNANDSRLHAQVFVTNWEKITMTVVHTCVQR